MNLPAPIQPIHVDATDDHSERLAILRKALRKLQFRKQEGDEHHADRIMREIVRLEGER